VSRFCSRLLSGVIDIRCVSTEIPQDPAKAIEEIRRRMILDQLQRSDDFGFELQAKAVLEKCGARVTHGWTYIDPNEDKPRQFDLRAHLTNLGTERHHLRLAVETKNLDPAAPLIVSGIGRTSAESFHDFVQSDGTVGLRHHVMRAHADAELYVPGRFVGKSLLRLKPDKADSAKRLIPANEKEFDIYGRWSQAVASASDLCHEAAFIGENTGKIHCSIILPVVVVPDGCLWTVEYAKDGSIVGVPTLTNATTFFVNHEITIVPKNLWTNLSHVHFFTLTGLKEFLVPLRRVPTQDWFLNTARRHQPPVH
jgi:hypothetical protein